MYKEDRLKNMFVRENNTNILVRNIPEEVERDEILDMCHLIRQQHNASNKEDFSKHSVVKSEIDYYMEAPVFATNEAEYSKNAMFVRHADIIYDYAN